MTQASYRLTEKDAVQIWHRYWAGEFQHTIAASFGVNPGRVNEVIKRKRLIGSEIIARKSKSD